MVDEQGVRKEDQGPVLGGGAWHLVSFVLLFFGIVFAFSAWNAARELALGVLAACAAPAAVEIALVIRLKRRIGKAQIFLPHNSLPLGFSGTATYIRPLRGGAMLREVEARLQCREEVVRGAGKNKRTYRKVVYDEPLNPVTTPMFDQLRVQIPFKIPAAGPASLDLTEAKIEWWIRMRLRMQGCPNTRSSFLLDVPPAILER